MKASINALSIREKQVVALLSKGLTYKLIAGNLDISPETVKMHLKNIYRKLGAKNKVEAIIRFQIV